MKVAVVFKVVSDGGSDYSEPMRAWKNGIEAERVMRKLEKRWRKWSDHHYRHNNPSDDVTHISYHIKEVELTE